MEPPLSCTGTAACRVTDVVLVATMITTVLPPPVAAAGVTVTEPALPAPTLVPVALPEVTRPIAAAAGAADTSNSSRAAPRRLTSPKHAMVAGESFGITRPLESNGGATGQPFSNVAEGHELSPSLLFVF